MTIPVNPAQLDPSKVKAGDWVAVEVSDDDEDIPNVTAAGGVYERFLGDLAVGPFLLARPNVTLTDHQPAPEPEPQWKRGDVAIITPKMWRGEVTRAIRTGDDAWATDGHGLWEDDEVSDVHELVVIDPADVNVDMVVSVIEEHASDRVWSIYDTIHLTLSELGIDVP